MSVFREVKVSTLHKWRVMLGDVFSNIYPLSRNEVWYHADGEWQKVQEIVYGVSQEAVDKMQELIDDVCRTIGDLEEQGFGRGGFGE